MASQGQIFFCIDKENLTIENRSILICFNLQSVVPAVFTVRVLFSSEFCLLRKGCQHMQNGSESRSAGGVPQQGSPSYTGL
jgi:hypothetical protein